MITRNATRALQQAVFAYSEVPAELQEDVVWYVIKVACYEMPTEYSSGTLLVYTLRRSAFFFCMLPSTTVRAFRFKTRRKNKKEFGGKECSSAWTPTIAAGCSVGAEKRTNGHAI